MHVHFLSETDRRVGRILQQDLHRLRSHHLDMARRPVRYSFRVWPAIRKELADLSRAEQLLSTCDLTDRHFHDRRPERADGLLPYEHSFAIVVESKSVRFQEDRHDFLLLRWPLRHRGRNSTMRADRYGEQPPASNIHDFPIHAPAIS